MITRFHHVEKIRNRLPRLGNLIVWIFFTSLVGFFVAKDFGLSYWSNVAVGIVVIIMAVALVWPYVAARRQAHFRAHYTAKMTRDWLAPHHGYRSPQSPSGRMLLDYTVGEHFVVVERDYNEIRRLIERHDDKSGIVHLLTPEIAVFEFDNDEDRVLFRLSI